MSIPGKQDILRFEVSIDHACRMKPFDTFNDFSGVEASAVSAQSTPSAELRGQIPARMKVENKIKIVLVMEGPPKFDDKWIPVFFGSARHSFKNGLLCLNQAGWNTGYSRKDSTKHTSA